jgi:hypothetical protein
MAKARTVNIRVDCKFFNSCLEPSRKKLERQIGRPISTTKFTGMIADNFTMKKRKTFTPKEFRRFKFYA